MKLLNFIKKNVLLVAAFATVIGFSAFKVVQHNSVTTHWFDVERINPNGQDEENNLKIVSISTSAPTNGTSPFGCTTENEGNVCQAQLDIGSNSPESLLDMSISDARLATGAPAPNYAKDYLEP